MVDPYFHGRCHIALKVKDLEQSIKDSSKTVMTSFLEYQRQGSNWTLDKIILLTLNIANYKPLRGSNFIPNQTQSLKSYCERTQYESKMLSMGNFICATSSSTSCSKGSNYFPYDDELDLTEIEFPMQMKDLVKFETQNGISVNVFGYEKGTVYFDKTAF